MGEKDAPPLAGQHSEYVFQSIKMFQGQGRIHDNDPEDDSFEEYTDKQLLDMLIDSELLPSEVVDTAIKVNQQMLDIMVAGATGEF